MTNECSSEVIELNKCYMYFVSHEDDILDDAKAEWKFCEFGRWLHEDCVEDVVEDNADEHCCSFCFDKRDWASKNGPSWHKLHVIIKI